MIVDRDFWPQPHRHTMTPDQEESSRYSGRPEGLSKRSPPPQDIAAQFEDFGLIPRPRVRAKPRLVDPLLGSDLGGVKIIRLIGEGGMGRVYEARQDRPRRTVAVKVIRQGITSEKTLRRFEREAEFLGRLQHRGIARIFVVGTYSSDYGDVPFYVMEHIADAKPITNYVHDHKLPLVDRLRLFQQVCEAVSHGHDRGIVHRDLKPGNILIDGDGQARVIDFGVARSTDADLTLTSMQTETGQLVGTMQYMSPEQFGANPEDLDGRADVYSLGVVLYEILTGVTPYEVQKKGIHEVARVVCEQLHVPIRTRGKTIPRDVVTITERCLQKDRRNRYPSAGHLAADIRRFIDGKPLFAAERLPLGLRWIDACMPRGRSGRKQLFIAVGTVVAIASILIAVAGVQRVMVLPRPKPLDGQSTTVLPPVNVELPPIPAEGELSRDVVVAADQIEGVMLGDFHKDDRLTIQYLSGEWTTCRERDKPCSPDTTAGGLRILAEPSDNEFGFNIEVPAGTERLPFDYTFGRDVSRVAIGMGDGHVGDNAGTVVYRVTSHARLGLQAPTKDTPLPKLPGITTPALNAGLRLYGLSPPREALSAYDLETACETLAAKKAIEGLASGGIAFMPPKGKGRSGARGIALPAPKDWHTAGSCWTFDYVARETAQGFQIVHPHKQGHVVTTLTRRKKNVTVVAGGSWTAIGWDGGQGLHVTREVEFDEAIVRRNWEIDAQVESVLAADGRYELRMNGKRILGAEVPNAAPFQFSEDFDRGDLPEQLQIGYAMLIVGPTDGPDENRISHARIGYPK